MRKIGFILLIAIAFLGGAFLFRKLLLSAPYVSLQYEPLYSAVSKVLANRVYPEYTPIEGKDYTLSYIKSFDNGLYAVASVQPQNTPADSGIIVLKRSGPGYKVLLGPANSLVGAPLGGLPKDVVAYLEGK